MLTTETVRGLVAGPPRKKPGNNMKIILKRETFIDGIYTPASEKPIDVPEKDAKALIGMKKAELAPEKKKKKAPTAEKKQAAEKKAPAAEEKATAKEKPAKKGFFNKAAKK